MPVAAELSSPFAPIPIKMHIGFCIFATIVFLIIYFRKKTVSSLIWLLACDTTAILQFFNDKTTATAVGICEIVMLIIIIRFEISEYLERRAAKKAELAAEAAESPEPDNREDIERLMKSEMQNIADSGENNVIKNAFEDDKP